ncbi:MAG TPA: hypothetical protein PKM63_05620 [Panacibacter sp.]|nr:hypothetical protein [Panacibacter sp.]HNP43742.1 hypothetical protein [Panacibacter sp.]
MANFRNTLIAAAFLLSVSCSGTTDNNNVDTTNSTASTGDSIVSGRVIERLVCKSNPAQSYALYIPTGMQNNVLPIVYFFDPHAAGALPLNKYKALADHYRFILVGSNNSKNGTQIAAIENIWQALVTDTKNRLHVDTNRMYVCGFSGGAKTASSIALGHREIKGVIAGGAALPDGTPAGNFPFSFTTIAGEGDLNMTDLIATNDDFGKTSTKHRIIFFNGIHEWSPESTMNIAFTGLQFDAMRNNLIAKNDFLIDSYVKESKDTINSFVNGNDLIHAEAACTLSAALLEGLSSEVSWFKQKNASIKGSTGFQNQWKERQTLLRQEETTKSIYMQQFQQGDLNYWTSTINDLKAKSKANTPEAAMNQRLLAYLSLSFYSITNHFVQASQDDQAEYFDDLYRLADSTNSEAWYFSALINTRKNNLTGAKSDLLKAVDLGFADKERMLTQVEFQVVAKDINLQEIAASIK